MRNFVLFPSLCGLGLIMSGLSAYAGGDDIKGDVVRGLTMGGPPGMPGKPTGKTCDFSREEVNPAGKMTGASVNCDADTAKLVRTLKPNFTAYCSIPVTQLKSATLLKSPLKDNKYHCDLSGISIKDATNQFGGAVWR